MAQFYYISIFIQINQAKPTKKQVLNFQLYIGNNQIVKRKKRRRGHHDAHSGREGAPNLELFEELAEAIVSNWDVESFDESMLVHVGAIKEEFYRY